MSTIPGDVFGWTGLDQTVCGFLGYSGKQSAVSPERFERALKVQLHRGPDAKGRKIFGTNAALGHCRLSIIDLNKTSNQPFSVNDRHWIIYNGEIFNYIELKDELRALGVAFRTESDTEVVLQAYLRWGPECVKRFNGMWAFCILDSDDFSVFGSRDRFGEKPFNYVQLNDTFFFASEIKALLALLPELANPNLSAIANYCRSSIGAQHENTWFNNVKRLSPGSNLFWKNGKLRLERYWSYPQGGTSTLKLEEASEQYLALLKNAVRLRLRSDVPVGLTLSSGLDSTSIAWAMKEAANVRFHCYTAVFDEKQFSAAEKGNYSTRNSTMSEEGNVTKLARDWNLDSHIVGINYDNYVQSVSEAVWHLESGNSSPAVIPNLQIMRRARENVTVVLEGQGADELLGGYTTATIVQSLNETIRQKGLSAAWAQLQDFRSVYSFTPAILMYLRQKMASSTFVNNFYRGHMGTTLAGLSRASR
jgi:asparagine synthase (glutamine-hydrolysing)